MLKAIKYGIAFILAAAAILNAQSSLILELSQSVNVNRGAQFRRTPPMHADSILQLITKNITSRLRLPIETPLNYYQKDCAQVEDCEKRCQCYYDRCQSACGDTDAECVNKCIRSWESCKEDCSKAAFATSHQCSQQLKGNL